jgi:hypothetical protein
MQASEPAQKRGEGTVVIFHHVAIAWRKVTPANGRKRRQTDVFSKLPRQLVGGVDRSVSVPMSVSVRGGGSSAMSVRGSSGRGSRGGRHSRRRGGGCREGAAQRRSGRGADGQRARRGQHGSDWCTENKPACGCAQADAEERGESVGGQRSNMSIRAGARSQRPPTNVPSNGGADRPIERAHGGGGDASTCACAG